MDNSSDTVLKKQLLLVLKSFAVLIRMAAIFFYYVIQITPSDAESCEEQNGKQALICRRNDG